MCVCVCVCSYVPLSVCVLCFMCWLCLFPYWCIHVFVVLVDLFKSFLNTCLVFNDEFVCWRMNGRVSSLVCTRIHVKRALVKCCQTLHAPLGLQIVQSRSYLYTSGPNVGFIYILGVTGYTTEGIS